MRSEHLYRNVERAEGETRRVYGPVSSTAASSFTAPRPLANLVMRSPGGCLAAVSACASAHVRRIWGDLDGGQRLPAYAPVHRSSRTGGGATTVTRASSQPPAVLLDVLGRRVRVEAGGRSSAAQVDALWSRCRSSDPAPGDETVITLPRSDRPLHPEASLRLADQIRELALAGAADRLTVLRAAAVAAPDGAVVALFSDDADTRIGAVAELSRRGFGYVTDELLATDDSFDVVAFPEPLRFAQDEQTDPESSILAGPDALGMRSCPAGPLHLAAAVLLEHDAAHLGTPS